MVRMGYRAWCALMNRKPVRARLALPREPGCRLCQDVALLTQAMVLTAKARQFLPLSACRPVNALAGVSVGLLHPSGHRLGVGSNSRANSSGVRPDRTRQTICRRNSGG